MSAPNFQDPGERMRHAREAMLAQFVAEARARAAALGLSITDEQAADAGQRLLKAAQTARADAARASKSAQRAEREQTFAVEQAKAAAQRYLDLWGADATEEEQRRVLRHMLDLASDDSLASDG